MLIEIVFLDHMLNSLKCLADKALNLDTTKYLEHNSTRKY